MKSAQSAAFVARHFPRFESVCQALEWMRLRRHAVPQDRFHIVLKKNRRRRQMLWEVEGSGKEIANCHGEFLLFEKRCHAFLYGGMRELAHGERHRIEKMAEISQRLRNDAR